MPTWPGELPDYVLVDGYTESMPDNLLLSQMDIGPPKARRRSTAGIQAIQAKLFVSDSQVETFITFYRTTLLEGSLNFDWEHPRSGVTVTMRFMAPPVIVAIGGTDFNINIQLGILP